MHLVFWEKLLAFHLYEIVHERQDHSVQILGNGHFNSDELYEREVNQRVKDVKRHIQRPNFFQLLKLQSFRHQAHEAQQLDLLKVMLFDPLVRGLHTGCERLQRFKCFWPQELVYPDKIIILLHLRSIQDNDRGIPIQFIEDGVLLKLLN